MNDVQVLERLSSAYATVEVPAPSAALLAVLDAGGIVDDELHDDTFRDDDRSAVVVPLRPRRARFRHLVAAAVATFVLLSGLAVAGALPDSLQRRVSSAASHLGIDLPSPDSGSGHPSDRHDAPDRRSATSESTSKGDSSSGSRSGARGAGDAPAGGTAPSNPVTTVIPGGLPLGGVGGVPSGTPTTLPPSGVDGLPPVTLPPVTVPPVPELTLPPVDLPPVTVPQLTVPLTLPPLTEPLAIQLPVLGL